MGKGKKGLMVESLKELNQICQKPRYKEVGNWMVRHILRDAALPVTWLLLHTRVSANQVTLASIIVGLVGISLFAAQPHGLFFLGACLLQVWYLLDHVDGQLARYHKTNSLTGRFFDYMMHHLIHGVLFFSLGFYVYRITGHSVFVLWGFMASVSIMMFNLVHDAKYKTFFERFSSAKSFSVRHDGQPISEKICLDSKQDLFKKGFSFLHKLAEIHVAMNILTFFAFLQLFSAFQNIDFRFILFLTYGCIIPMLAIVKMTYIIQGEKIDSEFNATIRIIEVERSQ